VSKRRLVRVFLLMVTILVLTVSVCYADYATTVSNSSYSLEGSSWAYETDPEVGPPAAAASVLIVLQRKKSPQFKSVLLYIEMGHTILQYRDRKVGLAALVH